MTLDRRLLYVFALLEAGMAALATLGGLIFMGPDPFYIAFGAGVVTLYVVAGQAASRGRRWGLIALLACECVRVTGFGLGAVIGALPWVELTLTGATLTDGLILPVVVAVMAARQLIKRQPINGPAQTPTVKELAPTVKELAPTVKELAPTVNDQPATLNYEVVA